MFTLLLGSDDFSKKDFIAALVKDKGADLDMFYQGDELPGTSRLLEADLFSRPKAFVFNGIMPQFGVSELAKLMQSPNQIVVSMDSLDKRKKENKDLLANKQIIVKEYVLPHGHELNQWIADRVKFYQGKISSDAAEELAIRLGRDSGKETKAGGKVVAVEEVYNLRQADGEIKKLLAYCDGREIAKADVLELVAESGEVDIFDLTNAIADREKQKAMALLQKFLSLQTGSDEKTAIIKLNALLAEQFRNVAMVQDFSNNKKSETQILEATGWKSGRLFIMKKIASKFPPKKVLEFLGKLKALDEELKTSSTPPRVLLDLIVAQLLI